MRHRLLDLPERERVAPRSKCVAIVPVDPGACRRCGGGVEELVTGQGALFFHGGYGATLRTVVRYCAACPLTFVAEVSEVNPRRPL